MPPSTFDEMININLLASLETKYKNAIIHSGFQLSFSAVCRTFKELPPFSFLYSQRNLFVDLRIKPEDDKKTLFEYTSQFLFYNFPIRKRDKFMQANSHHFFGSFAGDYDHVTFFCLSKSFFDCLFSVYYFPIISI